MIEIHQCLGLTSDFLLHGLKAIVSSHGAVLTYRELTGASTVACSSGGGCPWDCNLCPADTLMKMGYCSTECGTDSNLLL